MQLTRQKILLSGGSWGPSPSHWTCSVGDFGLNPKPASMCRGEYKTVVVRPLLLEDSSVISQSSEVEGFMEDGCFALKEFTLKKAEFELDWMNGGFAEADLGGRLSVTGFRRSMIS